MKVINIYDKDSDIRYHRRNLFETMSKFLKRFPEEYMACYLKNFETLQLFMVDQMDDVISDAAYDEEANIIFFHKIKDIEHELFHVASFDRLAKKTAIEGPIDKEMGMIEGMTEYLRMKAFGFIETHSYPFEVFNVMMLDEIEGLFKPYFMPSHDDFISLFPRRKDIYSLLFSLDDYHYMANDLLDPTKEELIDITNARKAIRDDINSLIDIELSFKRTPKDLKIYAEKFMDLIVSKNISETLDYFYPDYDIYANRVVNRRIKSRW